MQNIPKIIHYCWFGGGAIPQKLSQYIVNWKKLAPDYQVLKWSEENIELRTMPIYVQQAFERKKYAFVSDYIRLKVLYEFGGIYLDTDVEIRKKLDAVLDKYEFVTGFETENTLITAFIACVPRHPIIKEFLNQYDERKFILDNGEMDLTPINDKFTELMIHHGLQLGNKQQILDGTIIVYPFEYFAGYDMENSHPVITEHTYTVHHFQSSWKSLDFVTWCKYRVVVNLLQTILGYNRYDSLKKWVKDRIKL